MTYVFLIVSTVLFFLLSILWQRHNWPNLIIKILITLWTVVGVISIVEYQSKPNKVLAAVEQVKDSVIK